MYSGGGEREERQAVMRIDFCKSSHDIIAARLGCSRIPYNRQSGLGNAWCRKVIWCVYAIYMNEGRVVTGCNNEAYSYPTYRY